MKLKKSFSLSNVYQLIEPGPVVMVTTTQKGKANIMTMAWHMMMEFEPPLIGCIMSEDNYSFSALKKTKECVINIPTVELVKTVVGVGSTTSSTVDKFKKFNLTPEPSLYVSPPMIQECYANLECKVVDTKMVTKYNMFILEVVKVWITKSKKKIRTLHHVGNGLFIVDGKQIKLSFKSK